MLWAFNKSLLMSELIKGRHEKGLCLGGGYLLLSGPDPIAEDEKGEKDEDNTGPASLVLFFFFPIGAFLGRVGRPV